MIEIKNNPYPYGKPFNPSMPNEFKNTSCSYNKISNGEPLCMFREIGYCEWLLLNSCNAPENKKVNVSFVVNTEGYRK